MPLRFMKEQVLISAINQGKINFNKRLHRYFKKMKVPQIPNKERFAHFVRSAQLGTVPNTLTIRPNTE